ncbi:class II aldolase/adducin family protein [Curtobacterium flaccumfaciens]|nr:class II aldolase/adducin family protein [Curtobacterium flaccumfaciens]
MTDVVARLIDTGARLAASGISPGTSGNLSARDGDRVLMTGTGTDLGRLDRAAVSVLDGEGKLLEGPPPSKEVSMHLAMYRHDPQLAATVHVHAPHAMALSCLPPWAENSAVPPITPYFIMRVGQTPRIPYRAPGSPDLGRLIARHPLRFRAVLLANHGLVASGRDLEDALQTATELEDACRLTLATAGRHPELLTRGDVDELTGRYGTAWDHLGVTETAPEEEPMSEQPPLIPEQRRERILQQLRRDAVLSYRQLAASLDVSHMTVRRDIAALETQGLVHATPGGARIAARLPSEPPRTEKSHTDLDEKSAMSRRAASFVRDSMTVYLDAGTTLQTMAAHLDHVDDVTVVTNDLVIANSFLTHPDVDLILVGGRLDKANHSAVGRLPGLVLAELSIDIAFLTTSSWDLRRGVTIPSEAKVEPKQAAMTAADSVMLVAASSKYGTFARYRVTGLGSLDRIITDDRLADSAAEAIERGADATVDRVRIADSPGAGAFSG